MCSSDLYFSDIANYFPLTHIFYFDCKFLLTLRGVNMDNLAIKSILILMFVLIISKILDGAYSTMIIILGIGMVSALVVEYVKKGGTLPPTTPERASVSHHHRKRYLRHGMTVVSLHLASFSFLGPCSCLSKYTKCPLDRKSVV